MTVSVSFPTPQIMTSHAPMASDMSHNIPFPWKLHEMLDAVENHGFEAIVSWMPDKQSFRVHDPINFVAVVMKKFFKQTKYKSFQRQLNIWGFERILHGAAKGGYKHECFVKGQSALCSEMKRQKIKGTARSTMPASPRTAFASTVDCNSVMDDPPKEMSSNASQLSSLAASPTSVKLVSSESLFEFQLNGSKSLTVSSPPTCPRTGDCLLFEGMNFFFLDEDNASSAATATGAAAGTGGGRRLSLDLFAASRRKSSSQIDLLLPAGAISSEYSFSFPPCA